MMVPVLLMVPHRVSVVWSLTSTVPLLVSTPEVMPSSAPPLSDRLDHAAAGGGQVPPSI